MAEGEQEGALREHGGAQREHKRARREQKDQIGVSPGAMRRSLGQLSVITGLHSDITLYIYIDLDTVRQLHRVVHHISHHARMTLQANMAQGANSPSRSRAFPYIPSRLPH